jgi:hypothetical protein
VDLVIHRLQFLALLLFVSCASFLRPLGVGMMKTEPDVSLWFFFFPIGYV